MTSLLPHLRFTPCGLWDVAGWPAMWCGSIEGGRWWSLKVMPNNATEDKGDAV